MGNKNTMQEAYINEDFIWSHLEILENGDSILTNYSLKYLTLMRIIIDENYIYIKLDITITEDRRMLIKLIGKTILK